MGTRICVPTLTGQGFVSAPGEPASPFPSPGRVALRETGGGDLVPPSGHFQVCSPVRAAWELIKWGLPDGEIGGSKADKSCWPL